MQTLYLILAHFIADFVLQPREIIIQKQEKWRGYLFHAVIHAFVSFIVLLPFLPSFWLIVGVFALSFVHILIDYAKFLFEKKAKGFLNYFLIDQAAHLAVIFFIGFLLRNEVLQPWFSGNNELVNWYTNPALPMGLILLILATFGYELLKYQLGRSKKSEFIPDFNKMLKNLIIWSIVYVLILVFGVYSIAAFANL
jgi:hypothetical protein